MLTTAVLAVVGIGVGIIATTAQSNTYGPPGAHFNAAFPTYPDSLVACPSPSLLRLVVRCLLRFDRSDRSRRWEP